MVNINRNIYTNKEISEEEFERFHIACLIIAIRLLKYDIALTLANHIQLRNEEAIQEFTSERDLAYYLTICIIQLRDYQQICGPNTDATTPQINKFIAQDSIAQNCVNSLKRNDFKSCIKH